MSKLKIYRASAGAGKTYTLTKEYINLLFANPENYRHTLAVTFTNKACGEMKERIIKQLYILSSNEKSDYLSELIVNTGFTDSEVREYARNILKTILHNYSYFYIETIDSFFQRITRNFAKELGIRSILHTELNTNEILSKSIDQMFVNIDKNPDLKKWLILFSEHKIGEGKSKNLKNDIIKIGEEIFSEHFQSFENEYIETISDRKQLSSYFEKIKTLALQFELELNKIGEKGLEIIKNYGLDVSDFSNKKAGVAGSFEKLLQNDFVIKKRWLEGLENPEKWATKTSPKKDLILEAVNNGLLNLLQQACNKISEFEKVYNTSKIIGKNSFTLGIITNIMSEVKEYCLQQNLFLLAYNNVLLNKIIANNDAPFIYEKTGSFLNNFMIDEFQDTSKLQWNNFMPLLHNSLSEGNLSMIVGDVKQSIYRWRNGDWKLLAEEVPKIFEHNYEKITLNHNWRSTENIIDFNNNFFSASLKVIYDNLYNVIENETTQQFAKNLLSILDEAYNDICQKKHENTKKGGSINIKFIEPLEDFNEEALLKLPAIVEALQDKGVEPDDIVFLVSKNDECRQIVEFFMEYKKSNPDSNYCYDVISNEALRLSSCTSINFIIAYLQLTISPDNKLAEYFLNMEITKNNKNEDYETIVKSIIEDSHSHLSLFEIVEGLIRRYNLAQNKSEIPYIHVFQDIVCEFSTKQNSSVTTFLNWWNEIGHKKNITLSDSLNTMRVMTIHKSKGLEFHSVIIPFCNYKFENTISKGRDTIWCEAMHKPFSEIKYLPVTYSSELKNSIFFKEYWDEYAYQHIDKINMLYVAFTRAVNNLTVICPYAEKKNDDVKSFDQLLLKCMNLDNTIYTIPNGIDKIDIKEHYNAELRLFDYGSIEKKSKTEHKNKNITTYYPIYSYSDRLLIASPNKDFFDDYENSSKRKSYGIIIHKLLENITTESDLKPAINKLFYNGDISSIEADELVSLFHNKFKNQTIKKWFAETNIVLNECPILLPNGKTKRPDRIIIEENILTIIDYKLTDNISSQHKSQVMEYKKLLQESGFECKAYLWYLILDNIIEI